MICPVWTYTALGDREVAFSNLEMTYFYDSALAAFHTFWYHPLLLKYRCPWKLLSGCVFAHALENSLISWEESESLFVLPFQLLPKPTIWKRSAFIQSSWHQVSRGQNTRRVSYPAYKIINTYSIIGVLLIKYISELIISEFGQLCRHI